MIDDGLTDLLTNELDWLLLACVMQKKKKKSANSDISIVFQWDSKLVKDPPRLLCDNHCRGSNRNEKTAHFFSFLM